MGLDSHSRNNSISNNQVNNASHNLDFDPAAVIDGGGEGQEGLDLLSDNMVDVDILSILGQSDNSAANNDSDELLSLFDS